MIREHCGKRLLRITDNIRYARWKCGVCHRVFKQRKRQPSKEGKELTLPTESDIPLHGWRPYSEIHRERIRAHEKHKLRDGSMEQKPWNHYIWLPVLTEEVGEAARVLCDYELGEPAIHHKAVRAELRKELIQVAAMACAWIESIDKEENNG